MNSEDMIVNRVAIDWVTVGSFDQREPRRMSTALDGHMKRTREGASVMQYRGQAWESGFVGNAEQDDRVHTLCNVTGSYADRCFFDILRYATKGASFTRIDVQLTIELPEWYSARELNDYLAFVLKRRIMLIENSGLDTVYVGSRQSSRYIRIYVKEDSSGKRWLRFEIETKKDRDKVPDRLALFAAKIGRRALVSFFWDEIDKLKLPLEFEQILSAHRVGETAKLPGIVRDSGEKTFRWLNTTVRKAIMNYAIKSHGRQEFVKEWLRKIIDDISDLQV